MRAASTACTEVGIAASSTGRTRRYAPCAPASAPLSPATARALRRRTDCRRRGRQPNAEVGERGIGAEQLGEQLADRRLARAAQAQCAAKPTPCSQRRRYSGRKFSSGSDRRAGERRDNRRRKRLARRVEPVQILDHEQRRLARRARAQQRDAGATSSGVGALPDRRRRPARGVGDAEEIEEQRQARRTLSSSSNRRPAIFCARHVRRVALVDTEAGGAAARAPEGTAAPRRATAPAPRTPPTPRRGSARRTRQHRRLLPTPASATMPTTGRPWPRASRERRIEQRQLVARPTKRDSPRARATSSRVRRRPSPSSAYTRSGSLTPLTVKRPRSSSSK